MARIVGPAWMDTEHYAVVATLPDESRLRLRTRSPDDASVAEEFRSMLTQELVKRFTWSSTGKLGTASPIPFGPPAASSSFARCRPVNVPAVL